MKIIKCFRQKHTGARYFFIEEVDNHKELVNLIFSIGHSIRPTGDGVVLRVLIDPKDFYSFEANINAIGYDWELYEAAFFGDIPLIESRGE